MHVPRKHARVFYALHALSPLPPSRNSLRGDLSRAVYLPGPTFASLPHAFFLPSSSSRGTSGSSCGLDWQPRDCLGAIAGLNCSCFRRGELNHLLRETPVNGGGTSRPRRELPSLKPFSLLSCSPSCSHFAILFAFLLLSPFSLSLHSAGGRVLCAHRNAAINAERKRKEGGR